MAPVGEFSWVNEIPGNLSSKLAGKSDAPGYRPRRIHAKSRKGCQNCKRRRIKCDESKPRCLQCTDRDIPCNFADSPSSHQSSGDQPAREFQTRQKNKSHLETRNPRSTVQSHVPTTEEIQLYLATTIETQQLPNDTQCTTFELLNHFFGITDPSIGSPECQKVLQNHGLELSRGAPYLLHAILAFSGSHLNFLHPHEKKYEIAASSYYGLSLKSYSAQIIAGLDANNADSIVGCGYLHTMLAFRNVPSDDLADVVSLGWLRTMQGVRILWATENLSSQLKNSHWRSVCAEARVTQEFQCNHVETGNIGGEAEDISRALHQFLEVDFSPNGTGNVYQEPLGRLCMLLKSNIGHNKIGMFMAFIGVLPQAFLQLLDRKDHKAMMIICYWCALFSHNEKWWITRSAQLECVKLCAYLSSIPDKVVQDLLRFPASHCGYTLEGSVLI
ncbi:hypothetical protein DL95DRAFT_351206 [Leptodontidium sp. 2 PMI_412]|nr:hypothetical protein DL95DRAFT_351206 [Leptodontidium sp. 2 PMI_412]